MERLTHEADFGLEDWEETLFSVPSDPNGAYNILDIAKYQGEPEFDEILKSIALRLSEIENVLGDDYNLSLIRHLVEAERDGRIIVMKYAEREGVARMKELAKADMEGRCVVLPCKLHDKVFFIENGEVKETEVTSFHQWTSGHWKMQTNTDKMGKHWIGYEVDFDGIGKTVFLTGEDAEAALKGKNHD